MKASFVIIISMITCGLLLSRCMIAQQGQLSVPRIAKMPDQPSPYLMRDWKKVSMKYDSFVYDLSKSGQHLPFTTIQPKGINYPQNPTFRIHTYVGTNSPAGNEAINVLPSLVGASLLGIDKTAQFGRNWITMSQDFYNLTNGEGIYLNNAVSSSGQDWWYDVMPNIYFYQLHDLYGGINAEGERQFAQIADKFSAAVMAMGGSDTPWSPAFMNYRGWKFATNQPNPTGVPEPEAAGAFAWLLYRSFQHTGEKKYLRAAEWSMEFLDKWSSNPSYELQLPYGVLTAARMNAELGTKYNVEKMVNWCFDRGSLRGWGSIVGTWGGVQVSGLIGEANDTGNDYAFQMNGLHQAACLVPMVRYDKRFAAAIGKWVLNLANANRFFYPGFLPEAKQDAAAWSIVYDKDQVIGYEALRQVWQGLSPFSTGDAKKGGWAATNLALYGTSSIGYLGSIIEKTNVDKILRLDLLRTDFFKNKCYPSYLYYNPYDAEKKIILEVGNVPVDIYNMMSETFSHKSVSGQVEITVPAKQAAIVVLCPEKGQIRYQKNAMLVDEVVVDYNQKQQFFSHAPRIKSLAVEKNPIEFSKQVKLFCTAVDPDSPVLNYVWSADKGTIQGEGSTVVLQCPAQPGQVIVRCRVIDQLLQEVADSVIIEVVPKINTGPQILGIHAPQKYTIPGGVLSVFCDATDVDGDSLTYQWNAQGGTISGGGKQVEWIAPAKEGIYRIDVKVTDSFGASVMASSFWLVYQFDPFPVQRIALYPFQGNALDNSGNNLHGTPKGVVMTADRFGKSQEAYYFNGGAQSIQVANSPLLNNELAITVTTWVKPQALPERETFLLSHGSWQNRWKLSITPEGFLRWTVNTANGITDLDAAVKLNIDKYYHLTATYDGALMVVYVNGEMQSFKQMTGALKKTTFPFLMGQMLPDNTTYNFKGTLDEVSLYNYAMTPMQVQAQFLEGTNSHVHDVVADVEKPVNWHQSAGSVLVELNEGHRGTYVIRLGSMDGRVLDAGILQEGNVLYFDLERLIAGIYTLTVSGGNQSRTYRFLKM